MLRECFAKRSEKTMSIAWTWYDTFENNVTALKINDIVKIYMEIGFSVSLHCGTWKKNNLSSLNYIIAIAPKRFTHTSTRHFDIRNCFVFADKTNTNYIIYMFKRLNATTTWVPFLEMEDRLTLRLSGCVVESVKIHFGLPCIEYISENFQSNQHSALWMHHQKWFCTRSRNEKTKLCSWNLWRKRTL